MRKEIKRAMHSTYQCREGPEKNGRMVYTWKGLESTRWINRILANLMFQIAGKLHFCAIRDDIQAWIVHLRVSVITCQRRHCTIFGEINTPDPVSAQPSQSQHRRRCRSQPLHTRRAAIGGARWRGYASLSCPARGRERWRLQACWLWRFANRESIWVRADFEAGQTRHWPFHWLWWRPQKPRWIPIPPLGPW
jgi:hypothetical protein